MIVIYGAWCDQVNRGAYPRTIGDFAEGTVMTLMEISALLQSGVLSALAVLIVYRLPTIWAALLLFVERSRKFYSDQANVERIHQQEMANKTAAALSSLSSAIQELRMATHTICRFREVPNTAFFGERPPVTATPRTGS